MSGGGGAGLGGVPGAGLGGEGGGWLGSGGDTGGGGEGAATASKYDLTAVEKAKDAPVRSERSSMNWLFETIELMSAALRAAVESMVTVT